MNAFEDGVIYARARKGGGLCAATGTAFHNKGRHPDNVTNEIISEKETIGISSRTHVVDGCVQERNFWAPAGSWARTDSENARMTGTMNGRLKPRLPKECFYVAS